MMLSRISILVERTSTVVSNAFETSLSLIQPSFHCIKTQLMSTQQLVRGLCFVKNLYQGDTRIQRSTKTAINCDLSTESTRGKL